MTDTIIIILISSAIALLLGILILLVNTILPKEKPNPEKVEKILEIIPKRDCGACGYPGCQRYAEALAENPEIVLKHQCPFMMRDKEKLAALEKILGTRLKKD
jgi:Na+-translocating ferredoxin:NAD+ oxidoreductase subunit B